MIKRMRSPFFAAALLASSTLVSLSGAQAAAPVTAQAEIDSFAAHTGFQFAILDNQTAPGFTAEVRLTLPKALPRAKWDVYVSIVEQISSVNSDAFTLTHINGDLFRLSPKDAASLKPGETYTIKVAGPGHLFSAYYGIPNAYVASDGLDARLITASQAKYDAETGMETLPFVPPMTDEAKLATASAADASQWLTPERAFDQTAKLQANQAKPDIIVLPTPVSAKHLDGKRINLTKGLTLKLNGLVRGDIAAALSSNGLKPAKKGIPVLITVDAASGAPESYHLVAQAGRIDITAADTAGAAYALDSLGQQAAFEKMKLKPIEIRDAPRFAFRGLHLDLARNFQSKAEILKVINQMGLLKLNKLHLHLGDDEGWRLAISALPELTDIGSKRCFDLKEDTCLQTQLGAGPDGQPGVNGYLTRSDYIDILKAAKVRHIEVIPSFDMPGHSRAAVRSMEARARRLIAAGNPAAAAEYRLQDPADTTVYDSVQHYNDNTLNICMPSTYHFIDTVIDSIKAMHAEAGLPLKIYHIGTDETAGAWTGSPACQKLMADQHMTVAELGNSFITKVSVMLGDKGIEPGGWSDGMGSVKPAAMPAKVQSNSWGSLFSGGIADAYRQANQGWDVVLSTPDVLYFDMPNAVHPLERGYDWASRTTSLYKVFAFMPDNLPANAVIMPNNFAKGSTIADTVPLTTGHRITGMQGQLWSETVRSPAIAEYMLFPRTFALAERAWHTAGWEPAYKAGQSYSFGDGQVDQTKLTADWQDFNDRLAPRLAELEVQGFKWRVPPPGGRIIDGMLQTNLAYGELVVQYRLSGGQWTTYERPVAVSGTVELRSVAPGGKRFSRIVNVH